jgi:hypothetical protein
MFFQLPFSVELGFFSWIGIPFGPLKKTHPVTLVGTETNLLFPYDTKYKARMCCFRWESAQKVLSFFSVFEKS